MWGKNDLVILNTEIQLLQLCKDLMRIEFKGKSLQGHLKMSKTVKKVKQMKTKLARQYITKNSNKYKYLSYYNNIN